MRISACLPLAILLLIGTAQAEDSWGPWEPLHAASPKTTDATATELSLLHSGIHFFQNYISPVDGSRCPMSPTCSTYALQALDKHGPWLGTLLTVDRLLHENDPREKRIPVYGGDRLRFYDPLSNNDFWLQRLDR